MSRPPYEPRRFRPAWWAPGPHAQTLGARVLRPVPELPLRRERVETPDGDVLLVDRAYRRGDEGPLVLVLHGLEGSTRRRYMLVAFRELRRVGLRPVAMNFRGCGGEANRRPRFYHSGATSDPRFLLRRLREEEPGTPLGAVGFSLGGNVLLKLLGEEGSGGPLRAAVAISVPFDLSVGADTISRGVMGRLYSAYFLRSLRRKLVEKEPLVRDRCRFRRACRARTLRAFDDAATAPLHGFADAEDYYRRSSAGRWIDGIRVPTLVLHAGDDPFLPASAVPHRAMEANPHVRPVVTSRGGHVGFVGGPTPWKATFWAESEAARFLAHALTPGHRRGPGAGR